MRLQKELTLTFSPPVLTSVSRVHQVKELMRNSQANGYMGRQREAEEGLLSRTAAHHRDYALRITAITAVHAERASALAIALDAGTPVWTQNGAQTRPECWTC